MPPNMASIAGLGGTCACAFLVTMLLHLVCPSLPLCACRLQFFPCLPGLVCLVPYGLTCVGSGPVGGWASFLLLVVCHSGEEVVSEWWEMLEGDLPHFLALHFPRKFTATIAGVVMMGLPW